MTFVGDRVVLAYMHFVGNEAVRRYDVIPNYHDLRLTVLPIKWFYRNPISDK